DITSPAAPVIDPIAVGNDTTPEITGTAEPNSTVTEVIKDEQGNVIIEDEVAVDPIGNWSYTPDTALPEGKNEVVATATDAAGNTSNPSTPVELVVDITPPAAPTAVLANDTGITDGITSDATVNVSGLESDATWEYSVDGGASWTSGTGSSFELPAGSYANGEILVRQTDAAGNTSPVGSLGAVTIDSTTPGGTNGTDAPALLIAEA